MNATAQRGQAGADRLRALLSEGTVLAGSCYDGISAAVLDEAGFPCLTISGAGVAASLLGVPDIGLVTQTEMLGVSSRLVRRVSAPVIVDIDQGFGNALNVLRTVDEFIDTGIAGLHLEDQVFPKRCGHIAGKAVVSTDEFVQKVRAAVRARGSSSLVVIARTDAIAVHGLDDAIDRANRALDAGADVAFVEAPTSRDQIEAIAERVRGRTMFNLATGGHSPSLPFDDLAALGFALVVIPTVAFYPAIAAMRRMARAVLDTRSDAPLKELGLTPTDLFELVGMSAWGEVEAELAAQ